jgi:hypothetical protein
MFADHVVEAVLKGDRVVVEWNAIDDPSGNRHPPGLKYMFTELFCNAAGGPEVVTSKGFDEAKLGIDPRQWPTFLALVEEAAGMWPTKHHRELVMKICEASKVEICQGLEGEATPVVRGYAGGSDAINATGDFGMPVMGGCPFSGGMPAMGGCPFSGKVGGRCPISGFGISGGGINASASPPAKSLAQGVSEAAAPHHMGGRVLGSNLQQKLDELTDEDPDLCCPITLMVFTEPVKASDGFIYEKASLMQLLRNRQASPMTREPLQSNFQPAPEKFAEVQEFRKTRAHALIQFAREALAQTEQHLAGTALDRVGDYLENAGGAIARGLAREAVPLYTQLGRPVPQAFR